MVIMAMKTGGAIDPLTRYQGLCNGCELDVVDEATNTQRSSSCNSDTCPRSLAFSEEALKASYASLRRAICSGKCRKSLEPMTECSNQHPDVCRYLRKNNGESRYQSGLISTRLIGH